jgi:hypothetical protein
VCGAAVASGGAFHGQGNDAGTYALAHLLSILPTIYINKDCWIFLLFARFLGSLPSLQFFLMTYGLHKDHHHQVERYLHWMGRKLRPLCQAHAERAYASSTFISPRIAPQGENIYAKLTSNGILKSMPSLLVQSALPIVVGAFSIFVIRITNDLVDFYV